MNNLLIQENIIDAIKNANSVQLIDYLDIMKSSNYFFAINKSHYIHIENCFKNSKYLIVNILLLYFNTDISLIKYITELSIFYKNFNIISFILFTYYDLFDINTILMKSLEYNFTKLAIYIIDNSTIHNYAIDNCKIIFFSFLCKNYCVFKKLLNKDTYNIYNDYFLKYCYINNKIYLLTKILKYYKNDDLLNIIPNKSLLLLKIF